MKVSLLKRVENIVAKRQIAHYELQLRSYPNGQERQYWSHTLYLFTFRLKYIRYEPNTTCWSSRVASTPNSFRPIYLALTVQALESGCGCISYWVSPSHWDPCVSQNVSAMTAFWKHSDKRKNCSKRAISPFSTMFSTFSHRIYPFNYRYFLFFDKICSKTSAVELWYEGNG